MLSEEIKRLRYRLQLSQSELAAKLKVSPNTIWRWENGLVTPSDMHAYGLRLLEEGQVNEGRVK